MMFGESFQHTAHQTQAAPGAVKLAVRGLNRAGVLHDISFDLHAGEVVGIAGLMGSGRTELLRAIFGLDRIDSGQIDVDGQRVARPTPGRMKALGVGFTPEDRKRQGLVLPFTVGRNLTLASLRRASRIGILDPSRERTLATGQVEAMDIKTAGIEVKTRTLSGGNQQKVVVGNWLNTLPGVLIMDEPSRGIDIQAKGQIFRLVRDLAAQGMAVLFVSSEIEEVLEVADRILIMARGRIVGETRPEHVNVERLLEWTMEEAHA
jgi:ABC-type sugar transport system ATPase subunit